MQHKISPKEIYEYIDKYVSGQEEAKRAVSNAMFLHVVRFFEAFIEGADHKPSSILLMGPSGTGKTEIVKRAVEAVVEISGYSICPLLEVDCTHLAATGWSGQHLDDLLSSHYTKYGKNEAQFASTVVFLDEFDKLCIPAFGQGGTDHNRQTLYNMLKTLEGVDVDYDGKRTFSTKKMMFVYAGAFSNVANQRKADQKVMGFTSQKGGMPTSVIQELDRCGVPTQILGRINTYAELEKLTKKQLRDVLLNTKDNALDKYKGTWKYLGKDLHISRYHIDKIVNKCYNNGTGARGLNAELYKHLERELFEMKAILRGG